MPTEVARDIVNALFAGQKDLSDYVVQGMNAKAVDAIDAHKKEVGKHLFKPQEDGPENTEQPDDASPEASAETETETETEVTKDETDQGGD
jgi:hypothetical protein|tara:strand:- start:229 stop:501 length:273 start_codon:yes stop_codon:yes gene_type:complete